MFFRFRMLLALVAGLLLLQTRPASAQDGPSIQELSRWPMERVVLSDGRKLDGLIRHTDRHSVELVEVGRQPGRPMFLLVHWIPRDQVAHLQRLPEKDRKELQKRLVRFRNRTAIAQARRDAITLTRRLEKSSPSFQYRGSWFTVDSTADEALTRESIVRLEQFFAGYRTILPPRISPRQPLRLVLVRSRDAYLAHQRRTDQHVRNPAYFDPVRNEIVVGGGLADFAARRDKARRHHEQLLATQKILDDKLQSQLKILNASFQIQNADEETMRQLSAAVRRQWQQVTEPQRQEIRRARRANDRLFDEHFRMLYHEAFHAYLDNYVYDRDHYQVPRWLNEGWAQIFESGQLDAGTLRLDAPNPESLAALQKDLARDTPLALTDLLTAAEQQFLVGHDQRARTSNRLYLYSWGLAHYLTFQQPSLDPKKLDKYLKRGMGTTDPLARFEILVGMPLDEFESQWRAAMRAL